MTNPKSKSILKDHWKTGFSDGSGAGDRTEEKQDGYYITDRQDEIVVRGGADDWGTPIGVLSKEHAQAIAALPDLLRAGVKALDVLDPVASLDSLEAKQRAMHKLRLALKKAGIDT